MELKCQTYWKQFENHSLDLSHTEKKKKKSLFCDLNPETFVKDRGIQGMPYKILQPPKYGKYREAKIMETLPVLSFVKTKKRKRKKK